MSEKTIEELKAELDNLRKENLDREVKLEREKIMLAKKAEEEKNTKMLRDEIRAEVLGEMQGNSTVNAEPENEQTSERDGGMFEYDRIAKKLGYKLYDYKTLTRKISTGGYKEA